MGITGTEASVTARACVAVAEITGTSSAAERFGVRGGGGDIDLSVVTGVVDSDDGTMVSSSTKDDILGNVSDGIRVISGLETGEETTVVEVSIVEETVDTTAFLGAMDTVAVAEEGADDSG